jgi:CheY-like chemotaxis protein
MRSLQAWFSCWGDALIERRIDHLLSLAAARNFVDGYKDFESAVAAGHLLYMAGWLLRASVYRPCGEPNRVVKRCTDGYRSRRRSMPTKDSHSSDSVDTPDLEIKFPAGEISQREAHSARIRVLSVSKDALDHVTLRRILSRLPWAVSAAANCRQAVRELSRKKISVIFCESLLEDGTWKSILAHTREFAHPPLLVVTSRVADEHLWAEVLNLGGYDVLAKPFSPEEVRHVCTTASLWLAQLAAPGRTAAAG